MFRSLRSRLLFTHLLVAGLVLLMVGVGLLVFVLNSGVFEQQTLNRLHGAAELVGDRGPRAVQQFGTGRLAAAFRNLNLTNARAVVVGTDGEILADTRPEIAAPPAEVLRAAASGEDSSGDYGGPLNRWLYVTQSLGPGRGLVLLTPRPGLVAVLGEQLLFPLVVRAAVVALLASVLLAWLISRWVAAPLQRTASAARAVAAGDYQHRLSPSGPDEAHSLATSFNEMVQQVQSSQQAMRDFVANVSHELRTPLTSIQGYAQALLDGTAKQPERAAQVIHDEAARLGRLVTGLLDLAKLDSRQAGLQRSPVDLAQLLRTVEDRLRLAADERQIEVQTQIDRLPVVIGDGDRLAQVFTNLLDNALKHTPEGQAVKLSAESGNGWISVHVDDSGEGIPEEELPRIFERFYRLDKSRAGGADRGAGLGLAISREIVQAHGGTLTAKSIPGRGSRFTVRLPVALPDDETAAHVRS